MRLIRLAPNTEIKPFDCGDDDLNEFLLQDSLNYMNELLAVTYLLESDTETIAFFSLLNDKISVEEAASNRKFTDLFKKHMPDGKRFRSYPSMKIGRLGVSENHKGHGIGRNMLDYIKSLFITNNRTGCRYITVDAYNKSVDFYQKNGFDFFPVRDDQKKEHTVPMYFDLMTLISQDLQTEEQQQEN